MAIKYIGVEIVLDGEQVIEYLDVISCYDFKEAYSWYSNPNLKINHIDEWDEDLKERFYGMA